MKEAGTSLPSSTLASPDHSRRQGNHPLLLSELQSELSLLCARSLCSLTLKFQEGASPVGDAAVGKPAALASSASSLSPLGPKHIDVEILPTPTIPL